MSAGGGAMTRGNQLLSGNGCATDAPRNFRQAKMAIRMMKEMVDDGILGKML